MVIFIVLTCVTYSKIKADQKDFPQELNYSKRAPKVPNKDIILCPDGTLEKKIAGVEQGYCRRVPKVGVMKKTVFMAVDKSQPDCVLPEMLTIKIKPQVKKRTEKFVEVSLAPQETIPNCRLTTGVLRTSDVYIINIDGGDVKTAIPIGGSGNYISYPQIQ